MLSTWPCMQKLDELGKPVIEPLQSEVTVLRATNVQAHNDCYFAVRFLNIEIALCIYLCLMVTNCSGKRSFSKLKRIKNDLRLTMYQYRLNHLTLMSSEHEVLREKM